MLREKIKLDLNEAIKARTKIAISTLRLVLAALKDRDIAVRSKGNNDGVSDDEIKLMLQTMIKQRNESALVYRNADRLDLAEIENQEVLIISKFLPKQMTEDEINEAVKVAISETGALSIKDMGSLMSILKEKYAGRCDFSIVSKIARDLLSVKT